MPSKGRLQENAESFFARAGLKLVKPRGARDYRGAIAGLPGVEIAYLSASDITAQLAHGGVHLGVTGEDLIRETIPDVDARVVLVEKLGFGEANVVVAVPQAWIDVRTHGGPRRRRDRVPRDARPQDARRDQVREPDARLLRAARHHRLPHRRKPRRDRRRAGRRRRRTDRRHHDDRRDAGGQRPEDRRRRHRCCARRPTSIASRGADWGAAEREIARIILDRIAAQARARAFREVRTRSRACNDAVLAQAKQRFGVVAPFGGPTSSGMLTLHCPPRAGATRSRPSCASKGAESVTVADIDYVFTRDNPLYAKLGAGSGLTPCLDALSRMPAAENSGHGQTRAIALSRSSKS